MISFEFKIVTHNYYHPQIQIIQLRRWPYFGSLSLRYSWWQIRAFLNSKSFQVIARGPFAGWIALKLIYHSLIIQVRGLAAAEYQYGQNGQSVWQRIITKLRYWQLQKLEKSVYSQVKPNLIFECVSPALQEYLIQKFNTPVIQITIAQSDLPSKISKSQIEKLRRINRQVLAIPCEATVYCYSGSIHKWQCPEQIIEFFKTRLSTNPQAILLILCPQTHLWQELLHQAQISPINFRVLAVAPNEVVAYLAAADYGLLFRKPHLINWVARPTKALEYQAVGLKIIHNQTVEWLIRKDQEV